VPGVDALAAEQVRDACRLLDLAGPDGQPAGARELRRAFRLTDAVRGLVDRAPPGAREAFVRLAVQGPAPVEDLLGRGWWGRGTLPPPLDWLQTRALVALTEEGLVAAVDEARDGFAELTLGVAAPPLAEPAAAGGRVALRVATSSSVVVAPSAAALDRALGVPGAALRAVAPTVAVSSRSSGVVAAALRGAGLTLDDDALVAATAGTPALPGTAEDAVVPRAVRSLLVRAVAERRQVHLRYYASSRGGAATERTVDPWSFADDLLRGWCHLRRGERTFAVDRIGHARLLPSAVEHPPPA